MKGFSPVVVPEYFYMDGGVTVAKIVGKLHFGVLCVFDTDKASNKPDDDYVSLAGVVAEGATSRRDSSCAMRGAGRHKSHHGEEKS